jgi:hypothetical protein
MVVLAIFAVKKTEEFCWDLLELEIRYHVNRRTGENQLCARGRGSGLGGTSFCQLLVMLLAIFILYYSFIVFYSIYSLIKLSGQLQTNYKSWSESPVSRGIERKANVLVGDLNSRSSCM